MEKVGEDKEDPHRDNILVDGNSIQAIGVIPGSLCSDTYLDSVNHLHW
jgi:hypothetical protein